MQKSNSEGVNCILIGVIQQKEKKMHKFENENKKFGMESRGSRDVIKSGVPIAFFLNFNVECRQILVNSKQTTNKQRI